MEIELHPIGIEQGNHYFLSLHSCRLAEISGLYCTCLVKYMALSSKKHKGIVVTKKNGNIFNDNDDEDLYECHNNTLPSIYEDTTTRKADLSTMYYNLA